MNSREHQFWAAGIAEDLIARSDNLMGPDNRGHLRTVLRIAFEVQAFLAGMPVQPFLAKDSADADAREWSQDTVFSGIESILNVRLAWQIACKACDVSELGAGDDTFPADLNDVRRKLDDALRSVQDKSLPLTVRLRALNRIARLQILFLGATLW